MKKNKSGSKTPLKNQDSFLASPWSFIEWIGMGWACFVIVRYLNQNPIEIRVFESLLPVQFLFPNFSILFTYIKALFIWSGIVFGSFALGFYQLKLLKLKWHSYLECFIFSTILGFAVNSLIILAIAACRFLYPSVMFMQWFAIVTLFIVSIWKIELFRNLVKESRRQSIQFVFGKDNPLTAKIALLAFLILSFIMTLVPDLFYDALVYHLGVPNLFIQEHGIVRVNGVLSKVPMIWQTLYILGLSLQDEIIPKLIHWTAGLFIALGCVTLGRRLGLVRTGIWAAIFFCSVPMVQMNLWTCGIDIGGSLFAFCSLYAVFAYIESLENNAQGIQQKNQLDSISENQSSDSNGWIILSALMAGFAFGSKYQGGIIGISVLLILMAIHIQKREFKMFLKRGTIYSIILFFTALPWLIKNLWDTGNPVFPFLSSVFEKLNMQTYVMDSEQWRYFIAENRRFITESWTDFWRLPWILTFNDRNQSSLSFPGPLFLSLLPLNLLIFQQIRKKWVQAALLFIAVFFIFSFQSTHLTRYHLQGYPLLCFLYAAAFSMAAEKKKIFGLALTCVAIIIFLENMQNLIFIVQNSYRPGSVLIGRESREEYRKYTHPGLNPYPSNVMFRWMEKNLSAESRTLFIGETKSFDLQRKYLYTDVHGKNPLVGWIQTGSAEGLYKEFRKAGVTHILINFMEAYRIYGYQMFNLSDDESRIFQDFWDRHVRVLHQELLPEKYFPPRDWIFIYEVISEEEASKKAPPPFNPIMEIRKRQEQKS